MYFFRDSNGNETDVILESEGRYFLFEIKASRTVRLEHARNHVKLQTFFPNCKGYLLGFYEDDFQINENIFASNWTNLFNILDENFKTHSI